MSDETEDYGTLEDLVEAEKAVREHRLETDDPFLFLHWLFGIPLNIVQKRNSFFNENDE